MAEIDWDIRREGRAWNADEIRTRYDLCPAKIELIDGKLFWSKEDRIMMIGLLLEIVGADEVVRLGKSDVWRQAIADLDD